MSSYKILKGMIARARDREIFLDSMRKRKLVQAHISEGLGKRPKVYDLRSRGQQSWGFCGSAVRITMNFVQ